MRSPSLQKSPIPHQGSLCRFTSDDVADAYVIEITVLESHRWLNSSSSRHLSRNNNIITPESADDSTKDSYYNHELTYSNQDFQWAQRLFSILDTESRGAVDRTALKEFVTLRCPVFQRRDDDWKHHYQEPVSTFDEIWESVAVSCHETCLAASKVTELTVEGWMVFCRFIALAQYLEAKRRFSARHLQQTHTNAPIGSEVVLVDLPPLEPPSPLTPVQLVNYERTSKTPLPMPELDLDHSLVAVHDAIRQTLSQGQVKISLFGSTPSFSSSLLPTPPPKNLEFALLYTRPDGSSEVVVRRTMDDLTWLNATFRSHKVLGGTLCGRILPPFLHLDADASLPSSAFSAAATAGVEKLFDAAKSIRTYLSNTTGMEETHSGLKHATKNSLRSRALPGSYYNPNLPDGKARHLERYLNYLLEHPALSTSFPLNTILKVSLVVHE
jgi:hypothetical protein